MRSHLLCRTEQFVNITLPIADVDTAPRLVKERSGLAQVLQPAKAFLDFSRYPSGVDSLFQRVASVKAPFVNAADLIANIAPGPGKFQTGEHRPPQEYGGSQGARSGVGVGGGFYEGDNRREPKKGVG